MLISSRIRNTNCRFNIDTTNIFSVLQQLHSIYSEGSLLNDLLDVNEYDVFIDVGTSIGTWTVPAALMGARVYAYEPNSIARDALMKNLSINHIRNRVNVSPYALSSHVHTIGLNKVGSMSNIQSIDNKRSDALCPSGECVGLVKATTLDNELIRIGGQVDFIKIDVEGAELEVIKGAHALIKQRPRILIENHLGTDKDIMRKIHREIMSVRPDYNYKFIRDGIHLFVNIVHSFYY